MKVFDAISVVIVVTFETTRSSWIPVCDAIDFVMSIWQYIGYVAVRSEHLSVEFTFPKVVNLSGALINSLVLFFYFTPCFSFFFLPSSFPPFLTRFNWFESMKSQILSNISSLLLMSRLHPPSALSSSSENLFQFTMAAFTLHCWHPVYIYV